MSPTQDESILAAQRAKSAFIFREDVAPGLTMEMPLNRILHSGQSEFQQIDVIETYFGKTLVTDGKTQSAEFDEYSYHESLVHPALLNFAHYNGRSAKSVFIGGGGELATAREILRHPEVERVVMVDLDQVVIDVCVEHLPEWGGEAVKSNPRLELIVGDAYAFLLDCKEIFDVIVMDISDPIEAGPGIMLYTKELYQHAAGLLSPQGVFVTQAGIGDAIPPKHSSEPEKDSVCFGPIANTLAEVFPCVMPYTQAIPSFGSDWGFVMAFTPASGGDAAALVKDWKSIDPETLDELLIQKYIEGGETSLKMYDGITHHRMFYMTKALRKQLANDKRIMTKDNPIFMF
jgi:thermospermine synthase